MLNLLEAGQTCVSSHHVCDFEIVTYNKLAKSSIDVVTPNEIATVPQILENAVFFHREFGMRAGLPSLTCRWTQPTKSGNAMAIRQTNTIVSGFRILLRSTLMVLGNC